MPPVDGAAPPPPPAEPVDLHTLLGQFLAVRHEVNLQTKAVRAQQELERICNALLTLESYRLTHTYTDLGQRKFKKNPLFPYLAAVNEMNRGPGGFGPWQVRQQLEKAEKLARELPPDRKNEELLEQIHVRLRAVDVFNPFGRLFGDFFDPFGFADGEDEDDYGDDGW